MWTAALGVSRIKSLGVSKAAKFGRAAPLSLMEYWFYFRGLGGNRGAGRKAARRRQIRDIFATVST
jgi:hypothetical protein